MVKTLDSLTEMTLFLSFFAVSFHNCGKSLLLFVQLFIFSPLRLSSTQAVNIQTLGATTILVFVNVTEEDYGNYTCVASNRLGVQNSSLFLYREY